MMEKVKDVFNSISKSSEGLPHNIKATLFEILKYLDLETGIASGFSIQDLVKSLWVEKTQGRTSQEINKETIRSFFRTMNRCSNGLIQVTTDNKKLSVFFPLVAELYAEKNECRTLENHSETIVDKQQNKKEVANVSANVYAEESLYINNNYNLTKTNRHEISDDFYPSDETIAIAKKHGLCKVEDAEEIQKFIAYNKKHQTRWADYNPVFINWLVREESYQVKKQQLINNILETRTRSVSHASGISTTNQFDRCEEFSDEIDFSQSAESIPCATPRGVDSSAHQLAIEANSSSVWEAIP